MTKEKKFYVINTKSLTAETCEKFENFPVKIFINFFSLSLAMTQNKLERWSRVSFFRLVLYLQDFVRMGLLIVVLQIFYKSAKIYFGQTR